MHMHIRMLMCAYTYIAQQPQNVKVAEDLTESKTKEYENFIDSFVIFDK
jgi:hypothetical protein